MDVNKMAAAVFENVRGYVADALAPLLDRIKALEERPEPEPLTAEAVAPVVMPSLLEAVNRAVNAIPRPKDGASVTVDDLLPAVKLAMGEWALDFERRAQDVLERAIARIPVPKAGEDGKDGFSLENFDAALCDDGRSVLLTFTQGDRKLERVLPFPVVIDRGFWRDGMEVAKGDGVTFGGSYWIAQTDTATKPDIGNADWRLAVKKGRDGKNAP